MRKLGEALLSFLAACGGVAFAHDLLHPPLDSLTTYLLVVMMITSAVARACEGLLKLLEWVKGRTA